MSKQFSNNLNALEKKGRSRGEDLEALENVTKTLLGGMTGGQSYFAVTVNWEDGRAEVAAMKLMAAATGPEMAQSLTGIGDDAAFGPMNCVLVFAKGATGVEIDLRMVPEGRERGIRMAKLIDSRL